ncbi:retention module-containing protein [Aeromonas veronii]|uniref:retention module-containing protein n=6 Tax=Aeromonas veronii TaxID=654 RepID=UPI001D0BD7B0|nr:retention module-containing protein [Aeromonas veronii]MCC0090328.1 retention module-containing protein [Aeromonas veronii]
MRTQIIDKSVVVSAIEGNVEIVLADGSRRPLQKGEILQPGAKLAIADDAKLALSPYDDTPASDVPAGSESAEPAQPQVAASQEGAPSDIAALQESILQGVDPTQNFEASAAGGAPAAGGGGGIGGVAGASGNGGFVTIDRTGDATIAAAGFDTTYDTAAVINENQAEDLILENQLDDLGETAVTLEDTQVSGNLLDNSTNPDGPADASIVSYDWGINIGVPAGVAATITGVGTLIINPDGSYTFTPAPNYDGAVPPVNYQVTDGQDTVTSTLVVSITPVDEEVGLAGLAREGGEVQVSDTNLADGSDPNAAALTQSGVFTFNAPDGVQSLTLAGVTLITNGQLGASFPQSIISPLGNALTITAVTYNPVTGAGQVSYSYTLGDNENHTRPVNDTSLSESFSVVLIDSDGDTASDTLDVTILDDTPTLAGGEEQFVRGLVHEDALPSGNSEGSDQSVSATGLAGTLNALVNFGADGVGSFGLGSDVSSLVGQGLSSGGVALSYSVVGNVLTASAGGVPVFTLTVGADGSYSFTLSGPLDHPTADGDDGEQLAGVGIDFSGLLAATDGDGDPLTGGFPAGSFAINVEDDVPTATNDEGGSVTEDAAGSLSGNVLGNDTSGADTLAVFVGWSATGHDNSAAVSALATYGVFTQNPTTGAWSYTLDNSRAATQALTSSFNQSYDVWYTMKDADGDESIAKLTITIQGANDTAKVTVAAEGADSTVYEAGLNPDGSAAAGNSETDSDSFQVSASDGIKEVVIGGVTFSVATFKTFSVGAPSAGINTGEGTLKVIGYSSADGDKSATITYSYTLNAAQTHTQPANDTTLTDVVGVTVNGVGGSTGSGNLTIAIIDDVPKAVNDGPVAVTEDGTLAVSGNVLTDGSDDVFGADGKGADYVVWDANAAAKAELAQYGTLVLDDVTGAYSFTLNNASAAVQALGANDLKSVDLTYFIRDADGDTSPAKLTITIQGANDTAKVTVAAEGADSTVYEAGLNPDGSAAAGNSETDSDSFQVSASDGIKEVVIGGVTFSVATLKTFSVGAPSAGINTGEGTLKVIGYSSADGDKSATITYSYTLNAAQTHTQPANDTTLTDVVGVTVNGVGGSTGSGNLTIAIIDDVPKAVNDGPVAVTEDGTLAVSGNVFGADGKGADYVVWDANAAAKAELAQYGTLVLDDVTGAYSFTLNNASAAVQALGANDLKSVDLTYFIRDADGDTSPAKLTITIQGANDTAKVTVAAEGADSTVYEAGLNPDGSAAAGNSETDSDSFQVSASDGIKEVVIGGVTFSVATLKTFSVGAPSAGINTGEGTLKVIGYSSADGDKSATITYSYTLNAAQTHTQPANDTTLTDVVGVTVNGVGGSTGSGNLTIAIIDDVPKAVNDGPVAVTEDGTLAVSGNVLTDGSDDVFGADGKGADYVVWDANAAAKAELAQYGTLVLDDVTGAYSFTLNNASAAVQALGANDLKSVDLTYFIRDADGDTSPAKLTITIQGANDTAKVTVAAEGADSTVYEAGLNPDGSAAAGNSETDSDSFQVSASDGIKEVVIGGVTFSVATLKTFSVGAPSAGINTGEGTLKVIGYSSADGDKSATITYSYTLNAAQTHTQPANDTTLTDVVGVTVNGVGGSTGSGNLTIAIIDDVPKAVNDGPVAVTEDGTLAVSGNVLTDGSDDVFGADGKGADYVVWDANAAAKAELAQYGTLVLDDVTGAYSFTLNNASAAVQALGANDLKSVDLTYFIRDADGDTSPAKLTITIQGANDTAKVTVAAEGADSTVYEAGLNPDGSAAAGNSETDSDSFQVSASDGIKEVVIGGVTFSVATLKTFSVGAPSAGINTGEGTLKVIGYSSADGDKSATITYSYTLNAAQTHTQPANDTTLTDVVGVTVNGVGGSTGSGNLTIAIIDDVPKAVNDGPVAVTEDGTLAVSGNVLTDGSDDVFGADGKGADYVVWDANAAAKAELAQYGTLVLDDVTGAYSFTLNNASAAVQALGANDLKSVDLTYFIRDADGDTSPAKLTITIQGANDTAKVTVAAEGADSTVYEAGLNPDGSAAAGNSETDSDSFQVSASDGIKEVVIGGVTFSVATLKTFSVGAPSAGINTGEGTLKVIGYSSADGDKSATITYSYTLNAAQTHTQPANDTTLTDVVGVTVNGVGGTSASDQLVVRIVDDTPSANDDADSATEGVFTAVTGNVITGLGTTGGTSGAGADVKGADDAAVSQVVGFNGSTDNNPSGGFTVRGQYGNLTMGLDGEYSYMLTAASVPVGATDVFTYTLKDGDNDTDPATLTINIGQDTRTPVLTIGNATVDEEGLPVRGGEPAGSDSAGDTEIFTGSFTVNTQGENLTALTIGGGIYNLSSGGSQTLVDNAQGTLVVTGVTGPSGGLYTVNYTYTLKDNVLTHSVQGDDDTVNGPLLVVSATDATGDVGTGNLQVVISDDAPMANAVTNAGQATQVQNTNLMLILDISGSMGDPSGYQGMTRMQVMQKSALELLDKYDAYGNVMVNIITFATSAANVTGVWVTADEAKTIILGLSPTNATNYDDALNEAIKAFGDSGRLVGAQNISYFMSDGLPNRNELSGSDASVPDGDNSLGGGDGISGDGVTLSGEAKDWADFLTENNINSFALGMGSGATQSALDPIAYNGVSGANTTAVVVTDFSQLAATLLSTVVAPPLSGQLLNGVTASTGADGGWVSAITVAGVTYTYNQKADSASSNTAAGTFNTTTNEWSITVAGGILKVDMDNGVYSYTPPSSIPVGGINQSFGYSVIDNDGDTVSSTLSIIVNPAIGPTVVRDDFIITNQDSATIPDWALLVNDTGPLATTQTITGVSGAVSGTVTDNAGSVTFDDTLGNITPSTYQGSFSYTNSTTSDTAKVFVDVQSGTLTGSFLDEILIGGAGDETLDGNAGNDILLGGGGNDGLSGGDGNDILVGGAGNDTLNGGAGNDTASYIDSTAGVTVKVNGNNQATGGAGTDSLSNMENLVGSMFNDSLTGDGNANVLSGLVGSDILSGGGGDDLLLGGADGDTLTGGGGKDTFKWGAGDIGGVDVIKDFTTGTGGDVLDISELLTGEHANSGSLDAYLNFSSDGPGTNKSTLTIDLDGTDGGTTHVIKFDSIDLTTLGNSDLEIIQKLLGDGNLKVDP